MTPAVFRELLEERLEKTRRVLDSKATEYASTADRLHNFKRASAITGETPAQVCVGFMIKHLVSVIDMVDQIAPPSSEKIDEKIGDSINYLILLEGILREHLKESIP